MIALVNIVSKFLNVEDKTRPPTGLLYVGNALKQAGYEVTVFHIFESEIDKTVKKIEQLNPLYVGFSLFTGYPSYTSSVMSKKIKNILPEMPVIWGGVHPSLSPRECLKETFVNYVVIGEGEETIVELTESLINKKSLEIIKGIGYKKNGTIIINERRPFIKNLDKYEPDWSLINPMDYIRIQDNNKSICIVTSRGCPAMCEFCFNKHYNNHTWRPHSIDFVLKIVDYLKTKTGINQVSFDDDNFLTDPNRGLTILEELKKRDIACTWFAFRLEAVTMENIKRLRDVNVERIFFGWESGSNRILKLIRKGLTKEKIIEKCHILKHFPQIEYDASAIIGFPTETWEETKETIDTALEISSILPNVNFNLGTYMPYPTGTSLYEKAKENGFKPPETNEGWKNFDIVQGSIELSWLKWAGKGTKRKFYLIDKYAHYISKGVFSMHSKNIIVSIAKIMVYFLARIRLRLRFFACPFEVYLQTWWAHRLLTKKLIPKNPG